MPPSLATKNATVVRYLATGSARVALVISLNEEMGLSSVTALADSRDESKPEMCEKPERESCEKGCVHVSHLWSTANGIP